MLIEFSVANFGSFNEPQTLEMAPAENIQALSGHCFTTGLLDHPQQLLRSAVVYGPNASGKSQLVKAAFFMREMVLNSNRKKVEEPIKAAPFLLDAKTRSECSALQMIFVVDGRRYQYGFKADYQRVWSEWCYIFPRQQEAILSFRRGYDANDDRYHVEANGLEGIKDVLQGIPEDWLAITQFGQEKSQRWPELAAGYRWFQQRLRIIGLDRKTATINTMRLCQKSDGRDWVLNFLKAADLGVSEIVFKKLDEMPPDLYNAMMEDFENRFPKDLLENDQQAINPFSRTRNLEALAKLGVIIEGGGVGVMRTIPQTGEMVSFGMDMESTGTQKMFALAGDWQDILSEGLVFFVDEIESGLHHQLVRFLLALIHDPERNIHGSQLIATTHDTALLDDKIIRPDQVWLMNKNREYASRMFPLSDFDIKLEEGETLQKFYLDGHYGAVPMVRTRRVPVTDNREVEG